MLLAITGLPQLEELRLVLAYPDPLANFKSLAAARMLRKCSLAWMGPFAFGDSSELITPEQIDQLRGCLPPSLEAFEFEGLHLDSKLLVALLQLPRQLPHQHQIEWQSIQSLDGEAIMLDDDAAAEVLGASLPSLTSLNCTLRNLSSMTWLPRLTALRSLRLEVDWSCSGSAREPPPGAAAMLQALQGCSRSLTSLELEAPPFASDHMCALLPCLPHTLTRLSLGAMLNLRSLRCFDLAPPSLTDLGISNAVQCESEADLKHLLGLTALRKLALLRRRFALPEVTRIAITPPTALLPNLVEFRCS